MAVGTDQIATQLERISSPQDMSLDQVLVVLRRVNAAFTLPLCEQDPDVWGDQA